VRRLARRGHDAHDQRSARTVLLPALCAGALCVPAIGAGAARAASSVYVGNVNGSNVSQYAIGLGGALAPISPGTIAAESHPQAVAISPDAKSVYVANFGAESVSQYDVGAGGALTPKSPATVATGAEPIALAVSPDGRSVYVADAAANAVSQYDIGANGALVPKSPAKVGTGERPEGIAVNPDGKSVYVANFLANSVSQYAVGTGGALAPKSPETVSAGTHPVGVGVSPNGGSIYVADEGEKSAGVVSQYDAAPSGALSPKSPATVPAGSNAYGALVSPDGKSVYVANENSTVSQYDVGASGVLVPKAPAAFSVAGGLAGMAISPDGRSAYLANPGTNMISQYDVSASGTLTPKSPATVAGGEFPGAIAVTPDQGPIASFSASASPTGSPSAFDGSASSDPDGAVARFDWSFGDGTSAPNAGARPTHTYGAAGRYTVTLQVTDNAGCSAAELFTGQMAYCNAGPAVMSATIGVPVAPSVLAPSPPPPTITAAQQSVSRWREGNKLAQMSRRKRLPVGTTFSFSLNEQASMSFRFTQQVRGRKVGHRCIAQTNKNRHRASCRRTVTAGTLSFAGHSGTNKVVFQGRISRSRKLKPGRYTLVMTATNFAGARSAPVSLSFTIVESS
jgi:DNA-binding beta-propeller fold protein YncE